MYPLIRMIHQIAKHRNDPPLVLGEVHQSVHYCHPLDLDVWMELNNGRTLTLYDLGRIPMVRRTGLIGAMSKRGWSFTVAGVSVRYRRRVTVFNRLEMRSAVIGRDHRFIYIQQSMWHKGEAASSALFRLAVTGPDGIVPTEMVVTELGQPDWNPALPDWVQAWIDAEVQRVWPPEI